MAAISHVRGHPITFINNKWAYNDTLKPINGEQRPCAKCNCYPTKEGYDACLGHVAGAIHACCGHGIEEKYIILEGDS
ncbi:hypothetical protein SAMN05446037_100275 [Anaerovirgula multivorans]|uniref:Uncharacterized protein n=1 Tax=Anaerovirgula multivorans TaxID=312168 RepID=A0A239AL14_9FIRM|nr:hypothetical protein [Anaerovirgula multivorans]SNR95623.1 hypothetical protein SAMN05446037_100275 [Anaerovirgula multivorans]